MVKLVQVRIGGKMRKFYVDRDSPNGRVYRVFCFLSRLGCTLVATSQRDACIGAYCQTLLVSRKYGI